MVFLKAKMSWIITISPEKLEINSLMQRKAIILRLLEEFATRKATSDLGWFVAVTTLDLIGNGKVRDLTGAVIFPVDFSCVTFKPCRGEVVEGMVDKVLKQGIFLKSGLMEEPFIPAQTMPDYKYIAGENPHFLSEKQSKLEKDVAIRFKILGVQWKEAERSFRILGTLACDFLGPVARSN